MSVLSEKDNSSPQVSPQARVTYNVLYTSYWLKDHLKDALAPFELNLTEFNILQILMDQNGKPLSLVEIHDRMIQKGSNTTRIVEKLRNQGWLKRIQNAKSRRKVDISITPAGQETFKSLTDALHKNEKKVFKNLNHDDILKLEEILNKLRSSDKKKVTFS